MKFHCLFEQSGTFKNEFKKLGYDAVDYDICNDYGQTDIVIDLFEEIRKAYAGVASIFDNIKNEDQIIAFFPCTRFEAKIPLGFRGQMYQMKNWSDREKLIYGMKLHRELHELYMLISQLVIVCIDRGLKLVIENPYTQPHYLTTYWCMRPKVIDYDRSERGDYYKKPTQYWFINCEPKENFILEPQFVNKTRTTDTAKAENGKSRQVVRSEIAPEYANRFIREFLLEDMNA